MHEQVFGMTRRLDRGRSMDCNRVKETIYQFLDNEMGEEEVVRFEDHLAHCPRCARRRDFTTRWLVLVRRRTVRHCAPANLRARILRSLPTRGPVRLLQ